jgi:hypothetical protein
MFGCKITDPEAALQEPRHEVRPLAPTRKRCAEKAKVAMRLWQVVGNRLGYTHLTEVERKLRGNRCGNRKDNRVIVMLMDR